MQENNITTKLKTDGKMKWVGYFCLFVALVLTMIDVFTEKSVDFTHIEYWGGSGIGLLTINAGKRLIGFGVEKVKPIHLNNMEDDVK